MNGKAIKKPIPINWFKWNNNNIEELDKWLHLFGEELTDHKSFKINSTYDLRIATLEGESYEIPDGYIIIKGIQGEYYPCDPKIFKDSYELLP